MQIESPECQVAQAKINAYLSGTDLPEEAVKELEDHLAVCPDCQKVFAKHKEQFSNSQAEESDPAEAPVEGAPGKPTIFDLPDDPPGSEVNYLSAAPEPTPVVEDTFSHEIEHANKILEQPEEVPAFMQPAEPTPEEAATPEKQSKPKFAIKIPKFSLPFGKKPKPETAEHVTDDPVQTPLGKNKKLIFLSVSLFVVLAAMSFLTADPTRLFGKRAYEPKKAAAVESKDGSKEEKEEKSDLKTEIASDSKHDEQPVEDSGIKQTPVISKESHDPEPLPLASQREGQAASLASDELAKRLTAEDPDETVAELKEPVSKVSKEEPSAETPKVREAPALKPKATEKSHTSALEAEFKKYSASVNKRAAPSTRRKTSTQHATSTRRNTTHRAPVRRISVKKSTPKRTTSPASHAPAKSHVTAYGPDGKPLK